MNYTKKLKEKILPKTSKREKYKKLRVLPIQLKARD